MKPTVNLHVKNERIDDFKKNTFSKTKQTIIFKPLR